MIMLNNLISLISLHQLNFLARWVKEIILRHSYFKFFVIRASPVRLTSGNLRTKPFSVILIGTRLGVD